MPGMGTLINVCAIVIGGLLGSIGKNVMQEKIQETLMKAIGLCVMFIGIEGVMEKMLVVQDGVLSSQGTMVFLASFAIGSIVGEALDLEGKLNAFGTWLKQKTGSANDKQFVNAFVTASLTVCIGAMAIVGAIQEGMEGNIATLTLKAILDFLIIMIMSASLGKGCMFSAIPVGILQWSVTLFASVLAPYMTDLALQYISLTGNALIFCVGVNLIWSQTFRVANMLPTVVIAALLGIFPLF